MSTTVKQAPVIHHNASTEEEKRAAQEALRKFQETAHPKRVAIKVPTWNGRPVVPITSK
jgi:hypothetical protein